MLTTLSPLLLVRTAMALVDSADAPRTPAALVQRYLEVDGEPTTPRIGWSLPFVQYAGRCSHYDPRVDASAWPLPPAISCDALECFARDKGILLSEAPRAGDIYILWSPAKERYERAGIVAAWEPHRLPNDELAYDCKVIDADTDRNGWPHGPCTRVLERRIMPERNDRFVRWVDLELLTLDESIMARAA